MLKIVGSFGDYKDEFSKAVMKLMKAPVCVCVLCVCQEGVTPIDSIVTAVTALSQRSAVKPPKWVGSIVKAESK